MEQFVEGRRLYGISRYFPPAAERLVPADLLLNEAHYLGNLRYRVWMDMRHTVDFCPVVLDPNTAAPCVKISCDLRAVTYEFQRSPPVPLPQRIEWAPGVLGSQAFSPHDTVQFSVAVGDHDNFEIGFVSAKVSRKGPRPNSDQLLLLSRRGSTFQWNGDERSLFGPLEKVDRITVLYNGAIKMLTFTNVTSGSVLHATNTDDMTDHLFPFLAPGASLRSEVREIRLVDNV
ncbi:hypothetical protein WMY93_011377 [Mugilogobius chulae]